MHLYEQYYLTVLVCTKKNYLPQYRWVVVDFLRRFVAQ